MVHRQRLEPNPAGVSRSWGLRPKLLAHVRGHSRASGFPCLRIGCGRVVVFSRGTWMALVQQADAQPGSPGSRCWWCHLTWTGDGSWQNLRVCPCNRCLSVRTTCSCALRVSGAWPAPPSAGLPLMVRPAGALCNQQSVDRRSRTKVLRSLNTRMSFL